MANVTIRDEDGELLMRMAPGDCLTLADPKTGQVHTYIQSWGGEEAVAMETLSRARRERLRAAIDHVTRARPDA